MATNAARVGAATEAIVDGNKSAVEPNLHQQKARGARETQAYGRMIPMLHGLDEQAVGQRFLLASAARSQRTAIAS